MPRSRELTILRVLLGLGLACSFLLNLHAIPLFDLDEGAFSEATREMFLRGDFLSTWLNGEHRFDKPILIYWLQALSTSVFGFTEFGFRLPSALAAIAWIAVIHAYARRLADVRTALYAALFAATALQVSLIGRAAIADSLLNLLLTTSMFALYSYFATGSRNQLYLAAAATGLGFLTKGPVALLIPLAVSLLFCMSQRRLRDWWRAMLNPRAIALFAVIALPWYMYQLWLHGEAFIDGFLLRHNVARFQGPLEGHGGSLLYYLPVLLLGLLPHTAPLLRTVTGLRRDLASPAGAWLWAWFGFVFLFFSLSGTKLPHYIVYGYPALFVLMGMRHDALKSRWWTLLPALLLFFGLYFLPELLGFAATKTPDTFARDVLAGAPAAFDNGYRMITVAASLIVVGLMLERRLAPALKLAACGVIAVAVLWTAVVPTVAQVQQQPIKDAALLVRQRSEPLVMWRINTPSFLVYSQRLSERRDPRPGDLVLTKAIYLDELGDYEVLHQEHGIALVLMNSDS